MKRIKIFLASRFNRELKPDELKILKIFREWTPKLIKEVRERTIKMKSKDEPTESNFFVGKPTYHHARLLLRTVFESGFIRFARQTGKVYEIIDIMPDKAAIRNFIEMHYFESKEEANFRYGTLQYFCAITTSFTERSLSWVLLGRPGLNLLGEVAKRSFYENWKGERITEAILRYNIDFWVLFLVFYIMFDNNPEVRSDPKVTKMIVNAFMDIGKFRITNL